MKGGRAPSLRQTAWFTSARFKAIGRASVRRINAERAVAPRCTATAKHTGAQCRQAAMENGKCYFHGGRTPSGKGWHKPVWPDASAPNATAKLNRKLRDLDRAAKKRAKRVQAMTAEERAAYVAWKKAHAPGSAAARSAARRERQDAASVRALMEAPVAPVPKSPEQIAIAERLAELEALLEAREDEDKGVFG